MKLTRSPFFKVALAVLVGAAIAWAFWPGTKSTTTVEAVDSLAFYRQKEQEHRQAGAIIRAENEELWKAYRDTAAMRAPGWDSLRTRYRDSVQSQIRRKFAR
ncbi:hypothetical protein GCM10010967_12090 [Dyadobacter beijingensis]|uniref:Uncharacterized protein n=1 Tax=Dyadobacter beijingensis TaxID=365489 RepID=A0ABQ2HK86_9BACT|nr:hypothetical protein [Dyadobacter beijingensis]GGM81894.1 hypothetical protein GCM10010967_12090 [Dyadobacter beijingensis]